MNLLSADNLLVVSSTEWFRLTYKWLTFTFMQTRNTQ